VSILKILILALIIWSLPFGCSVKSVNLPNELSVADPTASKCVCPELDGNIEDFILSGKAREAKMQRMFDSCDALLREME